MSVRSRAVILLVITTLATNTASAGSLPDPYLHSTWAISPLIPTPGWGTYQAALRAGDPFVLQTWVHTNADVPVLSVDISALGLSPATTTSGQWGGYGAPLYPSYFYNYSLRVPDGTPDGRYTIGLTASNTYGTTTDNYVVTVDNAPPLLSLSKVDFDSRTPHQFDTIYLSGIVDGTGSLFKAIWMDEKLIGKDGKTLPYGYASLITEANLSSLNAAIASSTDSTFTHVPITFFWGGTDADLERAATIRVTVSGYDGSGFPASAELTVPLPSSDPCAEPGSCVSNVLFLPGIEGSRLYEGSGCGGSGEERLWEPVGESFLKIIRGAGDAKVRRLFLDDSGKSLCADIYTKPGDILDSAGGRIYASLIDSMNQIESSGAMNAWKAVPYDWRLSIPDLIQNGAERDGKIYYEEATSTPYIEQTLRALAATSKTGKVTIIAHSNGGLVAKALLDSLGSDVSQSLVDRLILVGVPQSGAPMAEAALLYGYDQGITSHYMPILHTDVARELAQNSPMAYHLLPSQNYFQSVSEDNAHPVARFAGSGYATERLAYGQTIENVDDFYSFLAAEEGGRTVPSASDLTSAAVLSRNFLNYAGEEHAVLDDWSPPNGLSVYQIAGWGADTLAGIDFYTLNGVRKYRPILTEDGDGTVPVPSALAMASSTAVQRYWLNIDQLNRNQSTAYKHKDLFEISFIEDFIRNVLIDSTSTPPTYLSTSQPHARNDKKSLTFILHSPLTLQVNDFAGNVTGLGADGSLSEDIPGSEYSELGDVKYITVPEGIPYELTLHGQAEGTFSLDLLESAGDIIIASSTIANVPTSSTTLARLSIFRGLDTASALAVDPGEGKTISIQPVIGGIVTYDPPPEPAPPSTPLPKSVDSPGSISIPVMAPQPTEPVSDKVATTPPVVTASTTVAVAILPKSTLGVRKTNADSPKMTNKISPQPASVYTASQQPLFSRLGGAIYNSLHGLWATIRKFF